MTSTAQGTVQGRGRKALMLPALIAACMGLTSTTAGAQEAIGVPFIGKHHLSFSVTALSRDGIGKERAAVFGGLYGRRFGSAEGPLQISMVVRGGARALPGAEDGILDAGLTLAVTRPIPALGRLSVTGAAGVGAMAWGQESQAAGEPETGRVIVRAPLSAGLAYGLRVGGATIAPFAAFTGAYSSARDYVDDERVATDTGWRLGHSAGVSVWFRETVLSLSGIGRERGLPNGSRVAFTAGMSW